SHPPVPPRDLHSFPTRRSSDLSNGTLRCYAPGHAATSSDHGHHVSGQDDAWVALAPGCTSSPVLIPSTDWGSRTPEGRTNTYLRSEEHTSELQSRFDLVCRLLL